MLEGEEPREFAEGSTQIEEKRATWTMVDFTLSNTKGIALRTKFALRK